MLSGLFFMLTLAAYLGYVRERRHLLPTAVGSSHKRCLRLFPRYLAVLACFIVGLAAKPMAVTLPFLLLLLDYWPLGDGKSRDRRSRLGNRDRAGAA